MPSTVTDPEGLGGTELVSSMPPWSSQKFQDSWVAHGPGRLRGTGRTGREGVGREGPFPGAERKIGEWPSASRPLETLRLF